GGLADRIGQLVDGLAPLLLQLAEQRVAAGLAPGPPRLKRRRGWSGAGGAGVVPVGLEWRRRG
ncbi:hypothetical protein, partial [Streptomyces goshikiensis]|uniref:hypothetical protein n=1 Tax=Streptomyces goshikiensis TaxID=1942 RepID=UPI0033A3BE44